MSKAVLMGAAELGAAAGLLAGAFFTGGADFAVAFASGSSLFAGLAIGGAAMEAGAIASALSANRAVGITTRQPAANRQVIYGEQRVGGVMIYESTTGGQHDQYNYVIVLAGHPCEAIVNLYLDGRQVFWNVGSGGNQTVGGINFGGSANGNTYVGPDGVHYNFGSLVYCEARYGTQLSGDVITGLTANDPNWARSSAGNPYVGGCTYVYLKVEYDATMFPQQPEIKFTVQGKNNILDPRTGLTGYTQNAALIVADVLCNTEYGVGFNFANEINQAQLIAAANLCDEQVGLAAGGTESRYTINAHFDTATSPADILDKMLPCMGGRMSWIGGEWYIFPAAWLGVSFTFDQTHLLATPDYKLKSFRDLFNEVRGTYVAPVYPYAVAGNLYDSNGFFEGMLENNFSYCWTSTDYPAFLEDSTHGYSVNQWLVQDAGNPLVQNISYEWVISCATAQRLAKIALRRNRQRGSATFKMGLEALQLQPCDIFQFTYSVLGWTNKLFEVVGVRPMLANQDGSSDDPPYIYVEIDAIEADPSVYDWTPATDELSPSTDLPFPTTVQANSGAPGAPTAASVTDSSSTAVIGMDGVARPRLQVSWTAPGNGNAAQIQIQYQQSGAGLWTDVGTVDAAITTALIDGVVQGQTYNVQLRALKSNGAVSAWVSAGAHTVSNTYSQINSLGLAPGVLPNFADGITPTKTSSTTYTLPNAPNPTNSLQLYQISSSGSTLMSSGYSVSGTTITLSAALATGVSLLAFYRY